MVCEDYTRKLAYLISLQHIINTSAPDINIVYGTFFGMNWAMESPQRSYSWGVHAWLLFTPSSMVKLWKKWKAYRLYSLPSNDFSSLPLSSTTYISFSNLHRQTWQKSSPITARRSENAQKLFGDRVCSAAKHILRNFGLKIMPQTYLKLQGKFAVSQWACPPVWLLCIHSPFNLGQTVMA